MTKNIPTVEDLKRKSQNELRAIFRQANLRVSNPDAPKEERRRAAVTLNLVSLLLRPLP